MESFVKTVVMHKNSVFGTANILVVDDDVVVSDWIEDALIEKNYLLDKVPTAEAAVEMLEKTRYTVIITDINLPGMGGKEFLQYCKKHTPDSAVIIITGAPDVNDAVSLMKNGAFDYLAKPLEPQKLYDCIAKVLQKRIQITLNPFIASLLKSIPPEYKVIKLISTTDTSVILLVEKEQKYYAMKTMKYESRNRHTENKLKRFLREAQIMRSINHPNIVKVYNYSFDDNHYPFILTEYVPTSSLTPALIQKMNFNEKLIFIRTLALALWEVHKQGIIHRDIKPGNIMVTGSGEPKLTDFGIASIKDSSLTLTKEILGSPKYMAPEVFLGSRDIDARSDIFSLGIVAYEMLTGTPPFKGRSISHIVHSVCSDDPIRPSEINTEIPEDVDHILAQMLAKDPDNRYCNIANTAIDLQMVIDGKRKEKSQTLFNRILMNSKKRKGDMVWASN